MMTRTRETKLQLTLRMATHCAANYQGVLPTETDRSLAYVIVKACEAYVAQHKPAKGRK